MALFKGNLANSLGNFANQLGIGKGGLTNFVGTVVQTGGNVAVGMANSQAGTLAVGMGAQALSNKFGGGNLNLSDALTAVNNNTAPVEKPTGKGYTEPLSDWMIYLSIFEVNEQTKLYVLDDKGKRKVRMLMVILYLVTLILIFVGIWYALRPKRSKGSIRRSGNTKRYR